MGKQTNDHNITVEFTPWTDNGFRISKLHVREAIYGIVPGGEIEMIRSDDQEALNFVTKQETGEISIQDEANKGINYSFTIFVTSRNNVNNRTIISFVVLPGGDIEKGKKFYTGLESDTYENIKDAVNTVYPGEKDLREETDIPDTVKIYRDNETGYDFVKRLCLSWKEDCLFAFGWDGLLIKKKVGINHQGDDEGSNPYSLIGGKKLWNQFDNIELKYNSKRNHETFNPWQDPNKDASNQDINSLSKSTTPDDWYKEIEPKYVTSAINADTYKIYRQGYENLPRNCDNNHDFYKSGGYAEIKVVGQRMPDDDEWRLGDCVKYRRAVEVEGGVEQKEDAPALTCIVASNELFFSQNDSSELGPHGEPFEWTTTLWAADKGEVDGWIQEPWMNSENE